MTQPATVCIATTTVTCRLIIWPTTTGHPIAWPMLVADPCPFATPPVFRLLQPGTLLTHAHVHYATEPGPWLRHAPCNRRPYLLTATPPQAAPPAAAGPAVFPAAGPERPITTTLTPSAAIRPQPATRCYGPPDAITALQRAGWRIAWDWTRQRHTLDGQPITGAELDAAAEALPPGPSGWAVDPRATGRCPGCAGRTADGLCLKCRWAAALTTVSPPA